MISLPADVCSSCPYTDFFSALKGSVEDVSGRSRRGVSRGQGVAHEIGAVTAAWSQRLVQTPLGTVFHEQLLGAIVVAPLSDFRSLYNRLRVAALRYVHYISSRIDLSIIY
jgi:hypothetical protein